MKLYIVRCRENASSRFSVYDDLGKEKYKVLGKFGVLGDTMQITEANGGVLAKIRQKTPGAPLTVFSICVGKEKLHITYNHLKKSYGFMGISWIIEGNAIKYNIIDVDKTLIMAQNMSLPEHICTVDIFCKERALLCIASAICIDSIAVIPDTVIQPI